MNDQYANQAARDDVRARAARDPVDDIPIWYLAGPFYRYAENVKALARKAGLRIVDASVTHDRYHAADPKDIPKVTFREGYAPTKEEEASMKKDQTDFEKETEAARKKEDAEIAARRKGEDEEARALRTRDAALAADAARASSGAKPAVPAAPKK